MATKKEERSLLTLCPICTQEYKTPKFISCGHTVCMDPCLQNILRSGSPSCPVCSSEIESTSSDSAETFPTNHALEAVLKTRENNLKTSYVTDYINRSVENEVCVVHQERLDKFCETCLEFICEKCVTDVHNKLHAITSLEEAAERYFNTLGEIEEKLRKVDERLKEVSETLENAKLKCKTDADSIRTKITEAGEWASQLVRKCTVDLSFQIEQKKLEVTKDIQSSESERLDLVLLSDYLKNVLDSLKNNQHGLNVTCKDMVSSLSRKTERLSEDTSLLEKTDTPDGIGLCFQAASSNDLQTNTLGTLEVSGSQTQISAPTSVLRLLTAETEVFRTIFEVNDYLGFASVQSSWKIFVRKSFTKPERQIKLGYPLSAMISPVTDILGLSVLGHNNRSAYKISCEKSKRYPQSLVERNLESEEENGISAISWDETRTDCYALLMDGLTIIRINFRGLVRRKFEVKLDEPVASITSRQFHVSELGGMAVCETDRKRVRYYDSVQTKVTKIVTAPPDIRGWYPVFVITRKTDQRWFVAWETLSYDIEEEGVPYARIYQYSSNFDLEGMCFKLSSHKIMAFCFSGQHFAVEKFSYNSKATIVSVSSS